MRMYFPAFYLVAVAMFMESWGRYFRMIDSILQDQRRRQAQRISNEALSNDAHVISQVGKLFTRRTVRSTQARHKHRQVKVLCRQKIK